MRRFLAILLLLSGICNAGKAFEVRAVYVDCRTQVMTMPALKAFANPAAAGGMNAIVMEWEATFPFRNNATLCNSLAYTEEEVNDFIGYCSRIGIEVIPLQNCFGHCEYILRHERYAGLREDSKDLSQVCPLKFAEASLTFGSIFEEIASVHPSRYIHIGCDETRLLGHDKACSAYVDEHGKSRLFVEYVARMCELVHKLGKTPIIWGDILLAYPEAASLLPSDIVVVDWNYGWKPDRFGDIDKLLLQGITMWGASALRSSPDNIYLTQWQKHLDNIRDYVPFCRKKGFKGIIETSWSTSGQYGYVMDQNSVIALQPIREVYPAVAFGMPLTAFFQAVNEGKTPGDSFVKDYAAGHFGLDGSGAEVMVRYFAMGQTPVTGKKYNVDFISGVLSVAEQMRKDLMTVRPKRNKADFRHLALMLDIRINYLKFKVLECRFESASFDASQKEEIASGLRRMLDDAQKLQKRFVRLNKDFLKDPSIPLGDTSYIGKMKELYAICK